MTLGTDVQEVVNDLMENEDIRSTGVLHTITRTNSNMGYDGSTETESGTSSIYLVPANYLKTRISLEKFGDLQEGEVRFITKSSYTIDTDDYIVFNGDNYNIRQIRPIRFNDVNVANILILFKKIV